MNQHPNYAHQAFELLETGKCQLPVDWADIAKAVSQSSSFAQALKSAHRGRPATLNILIEIAAIRLCSEADNGL